MQWAWYCAGLATIPLLAVIGMLVGRFLQGPVAPEDEEEECQ